MRRAWLALTSALICTACGSSQRQPTNSADAHYPATLQPPSALHPDFSVRQHITAEAHGRSGSFQAVLQKQGEKLLVVGLGPANVRMFVLTQDQQEIHFEQSFGPKLPFPPRNVLVDVHRAFYKRLPPEQTTNNGTFHGIIDDEKVEEQWQNGQLILRKFSREDQRGDLLFTFGPGCSKQRCTPETITIDNPWFDYKLQIKNSDYQFFDDAESTQDSQ